VLKSGPDHAEREREAEIRPERVDGDERAGVRRHEAVHG
jgi:hypothetical protein